MGFPYWELLLPGRCKPRPKWPVGSCLDFLFHPLDCFQKAPGCCRVWICAQTHLVWGRQLEVRAGQSRGPPAARSRGAPSGAEAWGGGLSALASCDRAHAQLWFIVGSCWVMSKLTAVGGAPEPPKGCSQGRLGLMESDSDKRTALPFQL